MPDLDAVPQENPKKFRLNWNASDPNEDELTFSLHFRKDGWKDWVLLEDNLDKKDFEWDTTTIPSGLYQFKVTASDRRDNGPEDALTATRTSSPRAGDAPAAHGDREAGGLRRRPGHPRSDRHRSARPPHRGVVLGRRQTLGEHLPDGRPVRQQGETFRFKTDALRPGAHILVLRVRDAGGNVGAGDVAFTVERK